MMIIAARAEEKRPGGSGVDGPAYYAYAVPKPEGLESEKIRPEGAHWNSELGEFLLMYDKVRLADAPEQALYAFLESTYAAAARLGRWDRSLETGA